MNTSVEHATSGFPPVMPCRSLCAKKQTIEKNGKCTASKISDESQHRTEQNKKKKEKEGNVRMLGPQNRPEEKPSIHNQSRGKRGMVEYQAQPELGPAGPGSRPM